MIPISREETNGSLVIALRS